MRPHQRTWARLAGAAAASLLLILAVGGCATVPRAAGFGDVERTIADRTGLRVHWNQGTAADRAVEALVAAMLRQELSADAAVQVALLNNRDLQATYEDLTVAQADLVSAGLLRNPVFSADVRFAGAGGGTGLELAVVQNFVDVLYIPLRARLAGAAFESAKARVAGQVLDLAGRTRSGFYAHVAARQSLEMRRQVLAATDASYDVARRLRAAGNIRALDLATERALHEQSKLDARAAEARVAQTRERLNRLMGLWGGQTRWAAADRLPDLPAAEASADAVERRAVERSLDLSAARGVIAVAGARLGIAAPFGWAADVEVGASAERDPGGGWAVGPAFSVPIPLFDQGQPAVAAAQAELRRARQRHYATAVAVRSHARAAHAAVVAAREQAEHHRAVMLPLRQTIVDETQLQYNAMQVGPLQLLAAKQQQIDAGAAYVAALRAYWMARTDLDAVTAGRMPSDAESAEGVAAPNASPMPPGGSGH